MSDNKHFDRLVAAGNPVGEVVAVNRFMVTVKGMHPVRVHSLVLFEDGSKGYVHHVFEDHTVVLHLGTRPMQVGILAVMQHEELVTKVGKDYIGRVISVTGEPLDGKGPIAADGVWPVFATAPPFHVREALDTQLVTGVTVIDTVFPLVRGQRMAMLGDGKSGKSTLATQIVLNQTESDVISVYVLIAKRRSDVDMLLTRLRFRQAMKRCVVIVSTMSDSLILSYLAPYVACSMAEYLWQQQNRDVLVVYDDLTAHAHAYREIALLSGMSPGRDSFPGDMFYVHSSLLERAGRLATNHKTLTALPLVFSAGGDITTYLSTNVMSITDGQWILDMKVFHDTMRPAVNIGTSVSRVGGLGQHKRQKQLAGQMLKLFAAHAQAQEFARFGSEMSADAQRNLEHGKMVYALLNQSPSEHYSILAQVLMMDIIMGLDPHQKIDVEKLKACVGEYEEKAKDDAKYEEARNDLKNRSLIAEGA